ncbi:hypothetical protein FRC11_003940, partial [Ceratobasidium sp. 423]
MSSSHSPATSYQNTPPSPPPTISPTASHIPSISPAPTELPVSAYGSYAVRNAIREMRDSPYWIGNPTRISNNFEWVESATSRSVVLKWKDDAPDRPENADEDAYITWFGVVTASGSVLGADGNYNEKWAASGTAKHKRLVRVAQPPSKRTALKPLWESQVAGAKSLVDAACRTRSGHLLPYKYCFFDKDDGALRARSPMFVKSSHEDTDTSNDLDIPEHMTYPYWKIDSPKVKMMFDGVVARGFSPRIIEAYDENDDLIPPNEVHDKLCGSIVSVVCTLEKMLFTGKDQPGGRAWQIWANLVK